MMAREVIPVWAFAVGRLARELYLDDALRLSLPEKPTTEQIIAALCARMTAAEKESAE